MSRNNYNKTTLRVRVYN